MKTLIITIGIILSATITSAEFISTKLAVHCIMGEARGEGSLGMQLVAEVLRRRGTTKGMYGCQAKFNEPEWVYKKAEESWNKSLTSNITNSATHFESIDYPTPYWAKNMEVVYRYKKHIFYKER